MGTRERLQRLTGEKGVARSAERPGDGPLKEEIRALRERIESVLSRRPGGAGAGTQRAARGQGLPLEDLLPGGETTNEAGGFFCTRQLAAGSARHGRFCIRDLAPLDMDRLALLGNDPTLRGLDYREALFLDTETTGLAGGTGTVAFLIGLGWFEGDALVTEQLFARDYGEERATLLGLRERLHGKRFLVSFNGKAFDANLLAARFIMNRVPDPLAGLPHLDLLHPARRLLSHRLADRRLGSLETALFGFEREGDIPGSEIPQRYFEWLRRRDGRLMAGVFHHNRLDILSLAALAAHLAELLDPGRGSADGHPGDRLAAARLFLARECPEMAVRFLDPLVGCGSRETARDAARELSLHYRRTGEWPAAVEIWEAMLERDGDDCFAIMELAKWCEHRRRDFPRALALAERAGACEGHLSSDQRADLARRRERLVKKLTGRRNPP